MFESRTKKFDKAAHHPFAAQKAGEGQDQIGGGGPRPQGAAQAHANHFGNLQGIGLAQQHCFRLDAAHAPAHDAEAVYHGGMGIGAQHAVRIDQKFPVPCAGGDHRGQVFEVDLMDDAGARRHHPEIVKGPLSPVEHGVALMVALHLQTDIDSKGLGAGGSVNLDGVVDHQVGRDKGVHGGGIAAVTGQGGTQRRQVDQGRNPGKILEKYPARHERDGGITDPPGLPGGQIVDILSAGQALGIMAEQVFKENAEGKRQALHRPVPEIFQGFDGIGGIAPAACLQGYPGIESSEIRSRGHVRVLFAGGMGYGDKVFQVV